MKIKDIGYLNEGLPSEVVKGAIVIYDDEQIPVLELYGICDEDGTPTLSDDSLEELAKDLIDLWNKEVQKYE